MTDTTKITGISGFSKKYVNAKDLTWDQLTTVRRYYNKPFLGVKDPDVQIPLDSIKSAGIELTPKQVNSIHEKGGTNITNKEIDTNNSLFAKPEIDSSKVGDKFETSKADTKTKQKNE